MKKAVYIAIGVTLDGRKDVLDVDRDVVGGHPIGAHGQDFLLSFLTEAGLVFFSAWGSNSPLEISMN